MAAVIPFKMGAVGDAAKRFRALHPGSTGAFEQFCAGQELDGWTTMRSLWRSRARTTGRCGTRGSWSWSSASLRRWRDGGANWPIRYHVHKYAQFQFFRQWAALRKYANERGIRIIGDVPIFVAPDSADAWAAPDVFHMDDRGQMTVVAGVPPDYFSPTGQRWGNPLYRWDVLAADGYRWWIERIQSVLELVDILRIDHFRGFQDYWEIPASEPTAVRGRWLPGPGDGVFDALRSALGRDLPIIAEDLGMITDEVHALRTASGPAGDEGAALCFWWRSGSRVSAAQLRADKHIRRTMSSIWGRTTTIRRWGGLTVASQRSGPTSCVTWAAMASRSMVRGRTL